MNSSQLSWIERHIAVFLFSIMASLFFPGIYIGFSTFFTSTASQASQSDEKNGFSDHDSSSKDFHLKPHKKKPPEKTLEAVKSSLRK